MIPLTMPDFTQDDQRAVAKAVASTFISGDGPECRAFEKELAQYLNIKHAFFTTSCTAALDLSLMIYNFPKDSEVIVPNFTFTSTALAPILNHLKIRLADVDPHNGNLLPSEIVKHITDKTVAIIPVDYAGNPADMNSINEIAQKHNLVVIHDAAQSFGATYQGEKVGNLGHLTCFSFHGTKNLTVGEGGALVTNDDRLASKIIIAREKGTDKHSYISDTKKNGYYEYVAKGNSYVQSDILAALGRSQLKRIDAMNARRRQVAELYISHFSRYENQSVHLPKVTVNAVPNWHLFYLLIPEELRLTFIERMKSYDVMSNVHYTPLHLNKYYREMHLGSDNDFPGTMAFYNSLVRIPLFSAITDTQAERVAEVTCKVLDEIL
ncbi:MAG: DegT/DnrJ/EryC1/StrS aminotransferase family protein [Gammaproteobacteria bacterium]|nr:DegT/DnrJ/EryC1/StrS aminotransferase family protein [Gammaproteobacteria bacterium]